MQKSNNDKFDKTMHSDDKKLHLKISILIDESTKKGTSATGTITN